jgi:hypothetical protein
MFEALKKAVAAIERNSASLDVLVTTAKEHLELLHKLDAMLQKHDTNTARKRHAGRMRAWRAAHDKTGRFVKDGERTPSTTTDTNAGPAASTSNGLGVERNDLGSDVPTTPRDHRS